MTHEYVLLVGGTVISGVHRDDASAIAWAEDTVLAIGTDADVFAVSRGDSHVVDLGGRTVIPVSAGKEAEWPSDATLDVGAEANLAVVAADPRSSSARATLDAIAVIRAGRVVSGSLPPARQPRQHRALG